MTRNSRNVLPARVVCTLCGTDKIIWRLRGRGKPKGHIKHTYCFRCKEVTEHREEKGPKLAEEAEQE